MDGMGCFHFALTVSAIGALIVTVPVLAASAFAFVTVTVAEESVSDASDRRLRRANGNMFSAAAAASAEEAPARSALVRMWPAAISSAEEARSASMRMPGSSTGPVAAEFTTTASSPISPAGCIPDGGRMGLLRAGAGSSVVALGRSTTDGCCAAAVISSLVSNGAELRKFCMVDLV